MSTQAALFKIRRIKMSLDMHNTLIPLPFYEFSSYGILNFCAKVK